MSCVCVCGGEREEAGGGRREEAGGSAQPKTRTPHKDVGKKTGGVGGGVNCEVTPANILLKQEVLQLAEAGFRDQTRRM